VSFDDVDLVTATLKLVRAAGEMEEVDFNPEMTDEDHQVYQERAVDYVLSISSSSKNPAATLLR
jgi:hypothetical protein